MAYEDSISIQVSHGDVSRIPTAKKAWIDSIYTDDQCCGPMVPSFWPIPNSFGCTFKGPFWMCTIGIFPMAWVLSGLAGVKCFFPSHWDFGCPIFRHFQTKPRRNSLPQGLQDHQGGQWARRVERRAAEIDFLPEPTAAYISCVFFPTCHVRVSRFEQRCNYFFSFFLFLNPSASSGCSGLRLDPNSTSWAQDAVGRAWTRTLHLEGPELHMVSSGCSGPRLDPNTCQRMPDRLPNRMSEHMPDRMPDWMSDWQNVRIDAR